MRLGLPILLGTLWFFAGGLPGYFQVSSLPPTGHVSPCIWLGVGRRRWPKRNGIWSSYLFIFFNLRSPLLDEIIYPFVVHIYPFSSNFSTRFSWIPGYSWIPSITIFLSVFFKDNKKAPLWTFWYGAIFVLFHSY